MTEFFDAPRPATAFDHDSTLVVAMELRQVLAAGGGGSRRVATSQARPEGRRHGRVAGIYAITVQTRWLAPNSGGPWSVILQGVPPRPLARASTQRGKISCVHRSNVLLPDFSLRALWLSAPSAQMRWAAIPTAVMRSSASLAADAPAVPKGAAVIMHAPSTTQAVTLTGTARAAMAEMAHTTAAPITKP